jgi:hypothetical protein
MGVIMKFSKSCWAACATALVAGAAHADDADRGFYALDDAPRFMLYVHKQIGAPRHKTAGPSFGFAIDRSQSMKVLDLRFAPSDGAFFFNGLQLTGKTPEGLGWESYGGPNRYLWWGAAGLGALLLLACATDNEPCDDGGGGGGYPTQRE